MTENFNQNSDQKKESSSDGNLVDYLRSAISDGTAGLTDVPLLVRQIIEKNAWRERLISQTKETVRFDTFENFICASPPEGLGTNLAVLLKMCSGVPDVIDLIDITVQQTAGKFVNKNKRGGDRRSENFKLEYENFKRDNVTIEKSDSVSKSSKSESRGNSIVYALRRLRENRPDLHKLVLEKKLSVNQAMIEAGLRKKNLRISHDVKLTAQILKTNFSDEQIKLLVELIQSDKC